MRIDVEGGDSKTSHFQFRIRRRLASLVSIGGSRRFSYRRLRKLQTLRLSVLKLDGSEFEVEIVSNATIAELKLAIEEVFASSAKEAQDKISWSLVWGHFCLCYEGHKLVNDKARIRNYGMKEGDQLQFSKHMSVEYSPASKRKPKKDRNAAKRNSISNAHDESEQIGDACNASNETDQENKHHFKVVHILRSLVAMKSD